MCVTVVEASRKCATQEMKTKPPTSVKCQSIHLHQCMSVKEVQSVDLSPGEIHSIEDYPSASTKYLQPCLNMLSLTQPRYWKCKVSVAIAG